MFAGDVHFKTNTGKLNKYSLLGDITNKINPTGNSFLFIYINIYLKKLVIFLLLS